MDTKISILFYGRKAKTTRDNLLPIYLRVTLQGQRLELSTHRYVLPARWSAEAGKVKGSSAEARSVNAGIAMFYWRLFLRQRFFVDIILSRPGRDSGSPVPNAFSSGCRSLRYTQIQPAGPVAWW